MELRQLEVVVAICREGGFTGAARRLGVTQPTLSKIVAGLEAKLDIKLFDRAAGSAKPTAFGRLLATRAEAILQSVGAISDELSQWARGGPGRIRIGFGPATRSPVIQPLVRKLVSGYPNLRLEVKQGGGAALVRELAQGHHEVVFSSAEHAGSFGDLIRIKIFDDDAVVVASPQHPLADRDEIGPRDVVGFPHASYGPARHFRDWVSPLTPLERDNATAFVCHDTDLIRDRLSDPRFLGIGARFMFSDDLASGQLVELPLDWNARYECWMLTTEGHWRSPVIQAIAELAKAVVGDERQRSGLD